jgi:hypothetical protein
MNTGKLVGEFAGGVIGKNLTADVDTLGGKKTIPFF